ncbi:thioredoxin-like protein [Plasmodium sp. gorilla clade G3]|nr:thioredoxin-like protein [Plasmodium sp. gorilla clade G3]
MNKINKLSKGNNIIFLNSKRCFYNFHGIYSKLEKCVMIKYPHKKQQPFKSNILYNKYITSNTNPNNKNGNNKSSNKKLYLCSLLSIGLVGYIYFNWYEKKKKVTGFLKEMKEISDELFDNLDNIVLFVLDKNKLNEEKKKIEHIKNEIQKLNIKNLNYLYTYNEHTKDYSCFLYKGRRRRNITEDELVNEPIKDIVQPFFTPVSENYEQINQGNNTDKYPIYVTHDTFEKEIIEDSKNNKILVVLFEDTCFLCFLYKPFINTLHKLFKENNIKLKIKKYNIEKNDYAPNMIVSRGTPTFLLYHNGKGNKLAEYKPNDIINKIDEIIESPKNMKEQMLEKVELIHERMHLFGYLTMWMTESKIIENMLIKRHIKDLSPKKSDDENIYNDILTSLIEEDIHRNDLIEESLNYSKEKIKEAEKGCFVAAMMMANELIDEEKKKVI